MDAGKNFLFLFLTGIFSLPSNAQFYTVQKGKNDMNHSVKAERITKNSARMPEEDFFFYYQDSIKQLEISKVEERDGAVQDFFSSTEGHEVSIEQDVPVFVNAKDSLLFGLISSRMSVCLPLDYISVNSNYGYRKDPFSKCTKFHDGIDLQCNSQRVYSMLAGVVKDVIFSKKGYGNHVVIQYGDMECLYGHLAAITVKKGDIVNAGTIIGVSGSSGRATGPHLHLKISYDGKTIDPNPFIGYLNRYISGLQEKIASVRFGNRPDKALNIKNLYATLQEYGVMFPKVVVAQAILETGYFTSNVCLNNNNLFGLRKPSSGSYYSFNSWEKSVKAYKDYVQAQYKGGDYFKFLESIGYAEDSEYISKVKNICKAL